MLGTITVRLLRAFRAWDRPTQIALVIALALLVAMGALAASGPLEWRPFAVIGAGGLLIVMQVIVLWGNRGLVAPYTRAQRAYLAGDFDTARSVLEAVRVGSKADMRELTLLGNTYRQLGQCDKSEEVLTEALRLRPNHQFPLYGFGRTLIVQGRYPEAIDAITRALEQGAPPVAQFDLGDAYFRQGLREEARAALGAVRPILEESYRALMADYLLYQLDGGKPPSPALIDAGLPYWRAEAERFHQTPYGQALADDVRHMQTLLGGGLADV